MIVDEARGVIAAIVPPDAVIDVRLVWDPPWTPDKMTGVAKDHFGWTSSHAARQSRIPPTRLATRAGRKSDTDDAPVTRTRRRSVKPGDLRPLQRVPLLVLGFAGLLVGIGAGLARLGCGVPAAVAALAALHGPLMICGFFGVVISLERAVAIGRSWAYLGPLLAGLGGVAAIAGASAIAARGSSSPAACVLLAASIDIFRRQTAVFTFTLVAGCGVLVGGQRRYGRRASTVHRRRDVVARVPDPDHRGGAPGALAFPAPSRGRNWIFAAIVVVIGVGLFGASRVGARSVRHRPAGARCMAR